VNVAGEHQWQEPSGRRQFATVAARLYWSYANLAMAHAALKDGAERYGPFPYYQIRAKLYAGLNAGTMAPRALFEDERLKILAPVHCAYCGAPNPTTADHLLPRIRGGSDQGENLVPCCRACNSSKGAQDVMHWHQQWGRFPSLSVTRRYLKLAIAASRQTGVLALPWKGTDLSALPFDISAVPMVYPRPRNLVWNVAQLSP